MPLVRGSTWRESRAEAFRHETHRPAFCVRRCRVERRAFSLKQECCPHCGKRGTLNRHSLLTGKGAGQSPLRVRRGQRAFCSNRFRRGGCGRTFSVFLAGVLPRHGVGAGLVSRLLIGLLAGLSLKAAVEGLRAPFALETFYHLRARLRRRMDALRVLLCRETGPPECDFADPFLQTLAHFRAAFKAAATSDGRDTMCAWFQTRFQRAFMG